MWWVLGSVADFVFDFGSLCLSSVWGETDCNTLYPESLLVNLVNYPGLRWHKVEAARLHSCMIGLRVSTGRPSRTPGAGPGGGGRVDES